MLYILRAVYFSLVLIDIFDILHVLVQAKELRYIDINWCCLYRVLKIRKKLVFTEIFVYNIYKCTKLKYKEILRPIVISYMF